MDGGFGAPTDKQQVAVWLDPSVSETDTVLESSLHGRSVSSPWLQKPVVEADMEALWGYDAVVSSIVAAARVQHTASR